ncbi:MAG: geranylgeranyl reductase family protein [Acidobacteriota bacterium]
MPAEPSRDCYDVIVVGSGPAGATAALTLAKQGISVLILEKATLPRYKTCGGGVVHRAAAALPVDISSAIERDCYRAEMHLLDANLHFVTQRSTPIVSMCMRDKLDFSLVIAAQEMGAKLQSECEVLDLKSSNEAVELKTSAGLRQARFVLAADGAMSLVARKAGWPETRDLIPALEYEVKVSNELLNRFGESARFDFGVVPYGYGWVFPKKAHLSIGLLSMQRRAINLNEMFMQYLRLIGIDKTESLERHGFLIPVQPRQGPFMRARVLLTGDAAGFADPVTGEGITFSILSGQLAARALLEGNLNAHRISEIYQSALAKTILPELWWGRRLAKLLYGYPRLRTRLFRRYGTKLSEAVTDLVMGKLSYRKIIFNPRNYLKLFSAEARLD